LVRIGSIIFTLHCFACISVFVTSSNFDVALKIYSLMIGLIPPLRINMLNLNFFWLIAFCYSFHLLFFKFPLDKLLRKFSTYKYLAALAFFIAIAMYFRADNFQPYIYQRF
jgi:hypothetical protein